jgi:hypothetical protein
MESSHALRDQPLLPIDQLAIDRDCGVLYPNATAQTKNRHVYTPVSAVLKRAGIERKLRRPKGWRGGRATSRLEPDQAFRLFAAADRINAEFALPSAVLHRDAARGGAGNRARRD